MKMFFGYSRYHSATQMLLDLTLPSFETLIVNSRFTLNTFMKMYNSCSNELVAYLRVLDI